MGINKTVDTVIVRKVFEMRSAGQKKTKNGDVFCHTHQWADRVLLNYSSETFRPLIANKRGVKRKTSTEEDEMIVQVGRKLFRDPVWKVLAELNRPDQTPEKPLVKATVSSRTIARPLKEAGARTVKAVKDELTEHHKQARIEWANIRLGDVLINPTYFRYVLFSDEVRFNLDPVTSMVRIGNIRW